MGTSTDAILFYGYVWKENVRLLDDAETDPYGDPREWDEVVLYRRGEKSPLDDFPRETIKQMEYSERRGATDKWFDTHHDEVGEWLRKRKVVLHEFGVRLDHHCSGDYSMPFLAIEGTKTTAYRGYPKPIDPLSLVVDPAWDERLNRWLDFFYVKKPHEQPGWWLVGYWG